MTEDDKTGIQKSVVGTVKSEVLDGCGTLLLLLFAAGIGFGFLKLIGVDSENYDNDTIIIMGMGVLIFVALIVGVTYSSYQRASKQKEPVASGLI